MGFRRYRIKVSFVGAALSKRLPGSVEFQVASSEPIQGVKDLVFLKSLASVPSNAVITSVEIEPVSEQSTAVAA